MTFPSRAFDAAEIDDLFKDTLKDGVKDDNFDVDADLKEPPITKPATFGRWAVTVSSAATARKLKPLTY